MTVDQAFAVMGFFIAAVIVLAALSWLSNRLGL